MPWKRIESINFDLSLGAMVRHRDEGIVGGATLIITHKDTHRAIATVTVEVTNPPEWEVWTPDSHEDPRP